MWPYLLPRVRNTADWPCCVMPRKWCGWRTDCSALIATVSEPSVPFLKPTGVERPLAISRWVCDSVVRAPIAVQVISSRQVLRHDRVERFGGRRHAEVGQVQQQFARDADAFLDVEGVVHVGIVDEAFPAHRRARLLEVDAHDQQHRLVDLRGQPAQALRVFAGSDRVVDRARTDDDEQARIVAVEDPAHGLAAAIDEVLGRLRQRQVALDRLRRREQLARDDVDVLESFLHGRALGGPAWPATAAFYTRQIEVRTLHSSGKNRSSRALARYATPLEPPVPRL